MILTTSDVRIASKGAEMTSNTDHTAGTNTAGSRGRSHPGPRRLVLGIVFTGLFLTGVVLGNVLASAISPSPFGDERQIQHYFAPEQAAALVTSFFLFASAVPLAMFVPTASNRLHY